MSQQNDVDDTEPLWAQILQLLYSRGLGGEEPGTDPWTYRDKTADTIVNELDARSENVKEALQYMGDIELVEQRESESDDEKYAYGLTQKGFEVAHEREMRNEQQTLIERQSEAIESQRDAVEGQAGATDTLADFTIILGVTALIQALAAIVSVPRYRIPLSIVYTCILAVLWYNKDEWFHGV